MMLCVYRFCCLFTRGPGKPDDHVARSITRNNLDWLTSTLWLETKQTLLILTVPSYFSLQRFARLCSSIATTRVSRTKGDKLS